MKMIFLNKIRFLCAAVLICLLASYALFDIAGHALGFAYTGVMSQLSNESDYEVRSRLLMEAMDKVGVCDAQEAAEIWASGLVQRSAALQYVVMNRELKESYALGLQKNAPNWVTGLSSPWVQGYGILEIQEPGENVRIVSIMFFTATSTGPAAKYKATLHLEREAGFWRIAEIDADDGLYPYTLFTP